MLSLSRPDEQRPPAHFGHVPEPAIVDMAPNMGEVLVALSRALDITEGQPPGHGIRAALIGYRLGAALGMSGTALSNLFYTVLLKDLGCSSNAARICELYLTDDLTFKHDFKLVNDSLPAALRFVLDHTGLKSGLAARFRAIITIVRNGGEIVNELIETRCQRGATIASRMGFPAEVATGIHDLDEHWDGSGRPSGLAGEAIAFNARIALLAQVVDVFRTSSDGTVALREARARRGTWFDPRLVDCLCDIAGPFFWQEIAAADIAHALSDLPPIQDAGSISDVKIDDVIAGFAEVVDAKSPYTAGHSARVALYADMIAAEMGLSQDSRTILGRGALLHDIGKLGVSNQILDKPGRLDEAEWLAIRRHPVDGCQVLGSIDAFAYLARIAEAHHERLDGKGYPHGLHAHDLDLSTRITSVADVFDALTADRPYRDAMPLEKAMAILEGDIGSAFDPDCVDALRRVARNL